MIFHKPNKYLIADTNFLSEKIKKSFQLVSIFPQIRGDGAYRATYEELQKRGALQSKFYNENVKILIKFAKKLFPEVGDEIKLLMRPVLVNLTNIYVDRSIRLMHRLINSEEELILVKVDPIYRFDGADDFSPLSIDWTINHSIIQLIGEHIGLKSEKIFEKADYPNYDYEAQQSGSYVNTLFWPTRKEGFLDFLKFLGTRFFRKILLENKSFFAKYSSLGFSTDDTYLALNGFYSPFGIMQRQKNFDWQDTVRDENLRKIFANFIRPNFVSTLKKLFKDTTNNFISDQECSKLAEFFPDFVSMYFPKHYLEGLKANILAANKLRDTKKQPFLIGTDSVRDKDCFFAVATKMEGGHIVGFQHGGHYGYVKSNSLHAEFEYSHYDTMKTYGWSDWDQELPKVPKVIPIASPRLSALQKSNWLIDKKNHFKNKSKKILFLLNKIHRFTHASTVGQVRIDFNDQILENIEEIFKGLSNSKIYADVKPYNQHSIDIRKDFFDKLMKESNGYLNFINIKQKGLSYSLLKNYCLLLWDQIGTGSLDCFVAKIPTMILWKRIYSRESSSAREVVLKLEDCGVIHQSTDTLIKEINIFLSDPKKWVEDSERTLAIKNFCHLFARTDDNWVAIWKKQLRELALI